MTPIQLFLQSELSIFGALIRQKRKELNQEESPNTKAYHEGMLRAYKMTSLRYRDRLKYSNKKK